MLSLAFEMVVLHGHTGIAGNVCRIELNEDEKYFTMNAQHIRRSGMILRNCAMIVRVT